MLGTGGSVTGSVSVDIPNSETARASGVAPVGVCALKDGSLDYSGTTRNATGGSTISLFSGSNDVDATNPFTFTAGDQLVVTHLVPL